MDRYPSPMPVMLENLDVHQKSMVFIAATTAVIETSPGLEKQSA